MFYVYVYFDPTTLKPFYVGKGKGDREKYHQWNVNSLKNDTLKQMLLQIRADGQQPIVKRVYEALSEFDVYEQEKYFIAQYGRLDINTGTLCNRTPGGEGFGNTGTRWTEKQRNKMKDRYIQRAPGVGFTQYDLDGVVICTYTNARYLKSAGFTITQVMAIRKCCKGERYSVVGFRWSYINEQLPIANTTMKSINQLLKDGTFVATYPSVATASIATGINQGDIASVARGNTRMKSAGGFKWTYC